MSGQIGSLWRDRDYVLYRCSRTVSTAGSSLSTIAGPLLLLAISGDQGPLRAGLVASASVLSGLVFRLPGGQWADRFDPRRLMLLLDAVRMVAVGSVVVALLAGRITFPHLLAAAVVSGAASAVFAAASMVYTRLATESGQFSRAMSQAQVTAGVVQLAGPVAGGFLYTLDPVLPFAIDAGSYLLSGLLLMMISSRAAQRTKPAAADGSSRRATDGLRWIAGQPHIARITLFSSLMNLVGASLGVAVVVVLTQRGTPPPVIGIVLASHGAGLIAGSLAGPWLARFGAARLFRGVGVVYCGALLLTAAVPSAWVLGVVMSVLAFISPATGLLFFQMLRDESPEALFGRVGAAQQLLGRTLAAAGPLLAGVVIGAVGGTAVWLLFGAVCLAATLTIARPSAVERRKAAVRDEVPEPAP